MPIDCSGTNVFILKTRVESHYQGGLEEFREDWPSRTEDGELVRLFPMRDIDACGIQARFRRQGLIPGRDYAFTNSGGKPELLSDGIVFERRVGEHGALLGWCARAGDSNSNVVSFPRSPRSGVRLKKGRELAPNLVVLDKQDTAGRLELSICVNPEGHLVFQRAQSTGRVAETGRPASESSWRTVRPENVPRVLVELMAERFDCEEAFTEWLKSKEIESVRGSLCT